MCVRCFSDSRSHCLVVEFAVRNQCLSKGHARIVKTVLSALDDADGFAENCDFGFFVVHDWFRLSVN